MRSAFQWNLGKRALELGRRTLVMGIVNVTPDSFSDGGKYLEHDDAVECALGMLEEGADIIDIGGESTRPGAKVMLGSGSGSSQPVVARGIDGTPVVSTQPDSTGQAEVHTRAVPPPSVSVDEELRRVLPVVKEVKRAVPDCVISVDTYKAEVARRVVEAGAEIVNDVSGFRWDTRMATTVAQLNCGAVLMHMRGRPEEWRNLPPLGGDELVALVKRELRVCATAAEQQGVMRDHIVLDPGFGFGKNFFENYPLLARFAELQELGYPLLSATSRKSFIGRTVGRGGETAPPTQRLYGTLATVTASVLAGAHIVRVHDVTPAIEACAVADAILAATTDSTSVQKGGRRP